MNLMFEDSIQPSMYIGLSTLFFVFVFLLPNPTILSVSLSFSILLSLFILPLSRPLHSSCRPSISADRHTRTSTPICWPWWALCGTQRPSCLAWLWRWQRPCWHAAKYQSTGGASTSSTTQPSWASPSTSTTRSVWYLAPHGAPSPEIGVAVKLRRHCLMSWWLCLV